MASMFPKLLSDLLNWKKKNPPTKPNTWGRQITGLQFRALTFYQ